MNILEQIVAGQTAGIVPLSVDQYHQMISNGILREGDSIELIDGVLVRKDRADKGGDAMSHGPRHAFSVKRLQRPFRKVEEYGYHLHSQLPVTLGGIQEPEPDLAVVRGRDEDYDSRHPGPADIAAIIEVSDSSLTLDRTTKQRLYASAAIPVYWIVNLVESKIEVYEDPRPSEGKYNQRTDYVRGQCVPLTLGAGFDINVIVDDVVPA
jgi:Uma2 family endonuclease